MDDPAGRDIPVANRVIFAPERATVRPRRPSRQRCSARGTLLWSRNGRTRRRVRSVPDLSFGGAGLSEVGRMAGDGVLLDLEPPRGRRLPATTGGTGRR